MSLRFSRSSCLPAAPVTSSALRSNAQPIGDQQEFREADSKLRLFCFPTIPEMQAQDSTDGGGSDDEGAKGQKANKKVLRSFIRKHVCLFSPLVVFAALDSSRFPLFPPSEPFSMEPPRRAALQPMEGNKPPELPLHTGPATAKAGGARLRDGGSGGALQHAHKDAIERLVERVVDVKMTTAQRENLQCYVYRLLGSRIGAPGGDEFQLVEKMKSNLAGSGAEGARKAVRFAEVYRRFSQKRIISNRWAIMHLLNSLRDAAPPGAQSAGASALGLLEQSAVFKAAAPPMPDLSSELEQSLRQLAPDKPPTATWRSHEALRTDHDVPESVLVRDVVFAMQGIDGQYIKFDKTVDGYAVERGQGVSAPTRDLVRRICESGWLYRKVSGAVRNMTENKRSMGMVVQGLAAGLQAELSEYYRLVAVLQAQSVGDVRRLGDRLSQAESVGHSSESGAHDTAPQPLTLRRLLVWTQEPIARSRPSVAISIFARALACRLDFVCALVSALPAKAHRCTGSR